MPANESGRFTVIPGKNGAIFLVDTWWGSAWRLYGDRWKYINFAGDAVPARQAPEDIPENFSSVPTDTTQETTAARETSQGSEGEAE